MRNLGYIFILVAGLTCCKEKKERISEAQTADTLLEKTISFPDELFLLKGNRFDAIDSVLITAESQKKMISIVDGNCMSCIVGQLNAVDSVINSILTDESEMIFVLNVSKADSAYFMLNLQPAIKATGKIFWDNNYNFERQNNLFTSNSNLRTFLVNEQNKIILYGNPIVNPDLLSTYQEKIASD